MISPVYKQHFINKKYLKIEKQQSDLFQTTFYFQFKLLTVQVIFKNFF